MLDFNKTWPIQDNVHFIHNWRCAGTSINSLLSSNYHDSYLKIGHPFTSLGWPESYDSHREPLQTLSQLRSTISTLQSSTESFIIGGHTFYGLECFFAGSWNIWMNYRDPLARLNSGILRFYSKKFKKRSVSKHLIDLEDEVSIDISDPHSIDLLLSTTLLRESNGISRRLAAISCSESFQLSSIDNVETIDIVSNRRYNNSDLFERALANLACINILINSEYLHHSLLSIESYYDLSSPIINPFSDLMHNSVQLVGLKKSDISVIKSASDVLHKHTCVDRKLLPFIKKSCSTDQ